MPLPRRPCCARSHRRAGVGLRRKWPVGALPVSEVCDRDFDQGGMAEGEAISRNRMVRGTSASAGTGEVARTRAAEVAGLGSEASYRYRIPAGGGILTTGGVLTPALAARRPHTFAVSGDSGTGWKAQFQVAKRVKAVSADFLLHAGDVVYEKR